ncbi:MAG TPA: hypothetical protein VGO92_02885 [Acidimicrobiales bacterium]|jgi:hypothetical protein|nr:hypothetical protein [Acidimicrobiales bacterium]
MTTTTKARAAQALQDWMDELPALALAVDAEPDARRVLLLDAAADEALLDKAHDAHPVLLARAHLAHAAIQLMLADVDGEEHAELAVQHADHAVELGAALAAPGPRLAILPEAGAMAALGMGRLRAARRRQVQHLLADVAEQTAEAYAEQAELSRRGAATLTAALSLAEGAKVVRGKARTAVLERALGLAVDARRDLARAGEVAKAVLAAKTVASLESKTAQR